MTTPYLLADLRQDEGLRLHAYPDPLSGGEPWTIGYGHTGPDVFPGCIWDDRWAEVALAKDIKVATDALDTHLAWWRTLDDVRQDVIANMAFNLGVGKLLGFKNTLAMIRTGDYAGAASNMLLSAWARQVGSRARRLSVQMRTGLHAGSTAPAAPPRAVALSRPLPVSADPAPVEALPEPSVALAPETPDPSLIDPVPIPPKWRGLVTMARDRIGAWIGGGGTIGGLMAAAHIHLSTADIILLCGLGVLILLAVLYWGHRKEDHGHALLVAARNAPPVGQTGPTADQIAQALQILSSLSGPAAQP